VPGVRADRARDLRAGRQEAAGAPALQEGTPLCSAQGRFWRLAACLGGVGGVVGCVLMNW